jgi:pimeloyl-ACP methyl ester carboxylesterase
VLVHGYPLTRQMWQPQVEILSGIARVLAPDLRGHGDSEAGSGVYSMELFADDLNQFLEALGIHDKIVLCGLSMGGYTAMAFQRKYAHRLRGLILTATRSGADSEAGRKGRDQSMALAREEGVEAVIDGLAPKLLAPGTVAENPGLVELVKSITRNIPLETVLADLEAMKNRPDSTAGLKQIDVPTLIVHGADDQLIPFAEAEEMQKHIRGAQLVVIPLAGHLLNLEQSELFNRSLSQFILEL